MQKETTLFEKYLQQAVTWIVTHQERFWAVTGLTAFAIAFGFFIVHHHQLENEAAWNQLGTIQGELMQNRADAAGKDMQQWEQRFQTSGAVSYAKFLKADLLYRTSDYTQAATVYGDLAQTARPVDIQPLALAAQSSAEEMAGHYPQALALAQTFTDKYPDHFLTAPMYMSQARLLELLGHAAEAAAIYDRFVILYPQSPWTPLARAREQALTGKAPSP